MTIKDVPNSNEIPVSFLGSLPALDSVAEDLRLAELASYKILDTPREQRFDDLLSALLDNLNVPYGEITFIDRDRIWYKSIQGIEIEGEPRQNSLGDLILRSPGNLINIPDLTKSNSHTVFLLINNAVKSVVCAPLMSLNQNVIGFVGAIDTKVRDFTEREIAYLERTSRFVMELLEAQREAEKLTEALALKNEEFVADKMLGRISHILLQSVNDVESLRNVTYEFMISIVTEYGLWGGQAWFDFREQFVPGPWTLSPYSPRTVSEVIQLPTASIFRPTFSQLSLSAYEAKAEFHSEIEAISWHPNEALLKAAGVRGTVQIEVMGPYGPALRMLLLIPSTRSVNTQFTEAIDSLVDLLPAVLKRSNAAVELNFRANHDELTSLLNRTGLLSNLKVSEFVTNANRAQTVLFLDIDKFKAYNDDNGHSVGDEVLLEVGKRLKLASRPADLICRYGGDEFVLIVDGLLDDDEMLSVGERYLSAVAQTFTTVNGIKLEINVSIGVTPWDGKRDFAEILASADTEMYQAKKSGGARVRLNRKI